MLRDVKFYDHVIYSHFVCIIEPYLYLHVISIYMTPPKWAQRFIEWYCKLELAEDLIGDLNEYFERNVEKKGLFRARVIYVVDALKFFRSYTARTPRFLNLIINWIMIGSHIKTSIRNISRNKLFSGINIVGLAIGMSIGLLLIAFVHDLLSYDRFNENGDRIYRITTHARFKGGQREEFATTSVKIADLIQDKVRGVEESATVRTEFSVDARIGDDLIPFTGLYAEPSMLKMFTFPMLKGNAATALVNPYSIVLTETSAKKLFGNKEAFGKSLRLGDLDYEVTGIMKDVPFFSHLQFECLVSYSTIRTQVGKDLNAMKWSNVYQRNYVYLMLPENSNVADVQSQLDAICREENRRGDEAKIGITMLPLHDIMLGDQLQNPINPVMPGIILWITGGLALVVILSACFNYTNLSIARSMRRYKEVGLRKVIGAGRSQLRHQFLAEAVIVSLFALLLSFVLFIMVRPQFLSIAPELLKIVKLEITVPMTLMFIAFSMLVGVIAGFLPALMFARVNIIHALKDVAAVKVFKGVSFRRALVVVQYTLTLIFITSTVIGYVQYKNILAFDLGFNTENILNINLQGNDAELLTERLKLIPEVAGVSQSKLVTSVGNAWGGFAKYRGSNDSTLLFTNIVDGNYIPLHEYQLVAGSNFITRPRTKEAISEVILNEKAIKLMNIANGDPQKAIGEEIQMYNHLTKSNLTIVGVIRDFHYAKLDEDLKPVAFTYLTPDQFIRNDKRDGLLNVRLDTNDPMATMVKIQEVWKSVDRVHPLEARFFDDQIEDAYKELSAMIKVIGFLSFVAISIASLGLLGMVVFTTETRIKEIGIRKVLGASSGSLVFLLSRGFLIMPGISALIALPVTYLFFENIVLVRFPFHDPVGVMELMTGVLAVMLIAFFMIGSQTMRAARSNPSEVLKGE